jgi:glutaconate CoA-transferase subunit B
MAAVLIRELRQAHVEGVRVLAITTTSSMVAGLAVRHLGTPIALAPGFGTLDAHCVPTLSLGDARLGTAAAPHGPLSDTFVAVARGRVGVFTSPAQLDARGATNLSRIGGSNESPAVALPGSRGLPDNNDSPSRVWYLFGSHSSRTLVDRVDFESGPPPSPDRTRRLITPFGVFRLTASGWRGEALFPGVDPADVAANTGFPIDLSDAGVVADPTEDELAALLAVDPDNLREIEFLPADQAGARMGEIIQGERASS